MSGSVVKVVMLTTGFYWYSFEHGLVGAQDEEGRVVQLELQHGGTSGENDCRDHVRDTRFSHCEAVLDQLAAMPNEALATAVMTTNQYNGKDNNHHA